MSSSNKFARTSLVSCSVGKLALTFLAPFHQSSFSRVVIVSLCGTSRPFFQVFRSPRRSRRQNFQLWFFRVFWYSLNSYTFSDVEILIRLHFDWCPIMGVACFFLLNSQNFSAAFVHFLGCCFDGMVYFCVQACC